MDPYDGFKHNELRRQALAHKEDCNERPGKTRAIAQCAACISIALGVALSGHPAEHLQLAKAALRSRILASTQAKALLAPVVAPPSGNKAQLGIPLRTRQRAANHATLADRSNAIYNSHIHPLSLTMAVGTVFINNRTQAVRLPLDVRLPDGVHKVDIRARGHERIIAPLGQSWDSFFMDGPATSDDFIPERANQDQVERESF